MTQLNSQTLKAMLWIGIGLMAAIDEIVFHQLLAWHHFYDRATPAWGLFADGLLHAAELIAIVGGFFQYTRLRKQVEPDKRYTWSGFLMGAGGFQVFDGIFDHKVLRVHQIRYEVDLLPYDLAWNLFGFVVFCAGWWLLLRTRRRPATRY